MIEIIREYPQRYKVRCDCCGKEKIMLKSYYKLHGWSNHDCPSKATFIDLTALDIPWDMVEVKVKDMDGNLVETLLEAPEFEPIHVPYISNGEIERIVNEASKAETEKIVAKKQKKHKDK
jgi:hypothetical protein